MPSNFWNNKKVLVTGGAGFIGSYVVEKLLQRNAKVTVLDNLSNGSITNIQAIKNRIRFIEGDCKDITDAVAACKNQEIVLHLASRVGGIEYNRTHQATMLSDNLLIETVMLQAAQQRDIDRFLVVSSACVYPRSTSIPTPETEGFNDEPEPTNGGYGWAKRMAEKLGQYFSEEFDMKIGIVRPYNCYGPRDHFADDTSHVIPALIKRVFNRENPVMVWGSGKQSRAFLYVEDLAEGMILAIEKYPKPDPINLGTNEEITIGELVKKIITISGISLKIQFDTTKPDGSIRRNSDNTKAIAKIDFHPRFSLDEGLRKTIEWYKKTYLQ